MNKQKLLSKIGLLTFIAVLSACGSQMAVQKSSSGDLIGGQGNEETKQLWTQAKTEVDAVAAGGSYSNLLMISINQSKETLDLILPLPPATIVPFTGISFPQLQGVTLEQQTLADGTNVWVISVPLKYVLSGKANLNPMGLLPNGDPIKYLPAGDTQGLSLTFPQNPNHKITIYLTIGAVAAFIETPNWNLTGFPNVWTIVKSKEKLSQIGFFEIVPNKGNFSSGVFLAAKLPRDITNLLGTIVKFN